MMTWMHLKTRTKLRLVFSNTGLRRESHIVWSFNSASLKLEGRLKSSKDVIDPQRRKRSRKLSWYRCQMRMFLQKWRIKRTLRERIKVVSSQTKSLSIWLSYKYHLSQDLIQIVKPLNKSRIMLSTIWEPLTRSKKGKMLWVLGKFRLGKENNLLWSKIDHHQAPPRTR